MRSQCRSPVADEEEPNQTTDFPDSSPSSSDPFPNPSKSSVNFDVIMLDKGQMKRPHRAFHVLFSFVAHGLFFAIVILIPLFYTQSINISEFQNTFLVAPPAPPPPPPSHISSKQPVLHLREVKLYAPRVIPRQIAQIKSEPQPQPASPGIFGGVLGGVPSGQLGGVLGAIAGAGNHQVIPSPPPPPLHRGPYRVGGKIQAPRLVTEVKPVYPVLAKETRISGKVVIDCVIDEHGDITQMKVVSGHPFLVTAALHAVEQWKYQPTLLNGRPIAVSMIVTVTFVLGN